MNKQPTIEDMNRVIAEFMGVYKNNKWMVLPDRKYALSTRYYPSTLKYHSDWNWLMPVVEKISKIPLQNYDGTACIDLADTCHPITFNMPDEEGNVMFRFKGFSLHRGKTLIEAAYSAVYEVIESMSLN